MYFLNPETAPLSFLGCVMEPSCHGSSDTFVIPSSWRGLGAADRCWALEISRYPGTLEPSYEKQRQHLVKLLLPWLHLGASQKRCLTLQKEQRRGLKLPAPLLEGNAFRHTPINQKCLSLEAWVTSPGLQWRLLFHVACAGRCRRSTAPPLMSCAEGTTYRGVSPAVSYYNRLSSLRGVFVVVLKSGCEP